MTLSVEKLTPAEWALLAENAHKVMFKEVRKATTDRIDFALLALVNTEIVAYATVRELDDESIYLQYGGAFEEIAKTPTVLRAYLAFLEKLICGGYKRVSTLVSNQNIPYLKLAMKAGFRVIGVRVFKGETFVELFLEFPNA